MFYSVKFNRKSDQLSCGEIDPLDWHFSFAGTEFPQSLTFEKGNASTLLVTDNLGEIQFYFHRGWAKRPETLEQVFVFKVLKKEIANPAKDS